MDEHDFKSALRNTMAAHPEPPPMSETAVLDAVRHDRRRRRTVWAGLGSAAAVVAIAAGVVIIAPSLPGQGEEIDLGASPTATGTSPVTTGPQRTAESGPEYETGVRLLDELVDVVPDGYTSPEKLDDLGHLSRKALKYHQAVGEHEGDGPETWQYMAKVPVMQGSGFGSLTVLVAEAPYTQPGGKCAVPSALWGPPGTCTEVVVDGKQTGVFEFAHNPWGQQWAVYVHEDGTAVFVMQSLNYDEMGLYSSPLAGWPMTPERLAGLAVDPRFRVDLD